MELICKSRAKNDPISRSTQNTVVFDRLLMEANPLVRAVSGRGHEFSLHARKHLFHRAALIDIPYVRWPTVSVMEADMQAVAALADQMRLRIATISTNIAVAEDSETH